MGKSLFVLESNWEKKNKFVLGIRESVQVGFDVANNGRSYSSWCIKKQIVSIVRRGEGGGGGWMGLVPMICNKMIIFK